MAQVPSFDCATRSNHTETKTGVPGFIGSLVSAPLFRYWLRPHYNGGSFVSVHNCSVVTTICCLAGNRAHNRSTCRVNRPAPEKSFFGVLALAGDKFLALPGFRGNLFYVVQQNGTTAIPVGDCHNDLHRSVQKARSLKKRK
jgi:hypothetical protein